MGCMNLEIINLFKGNLECRMHVKNFVNCVCEFIDYLFIYLFALLLGIYTRPVCSDVSRAVNL